MQKGARPLPPRTFQGHKHSGAAFLLLESRPRYSALPLHSCASTVQARASRFHLAGCRAFPFLSGGLRKCAANWRGLQSGQRRYCTARGLSAPDTAERDVQPAWRSPCKCGERGEGGNKYVGGEVRRGSGLPPWDLWRPACASGARARPCASTTQGRSHEKGSRLPAQLCATQRRLTVSSFKKNLNEFAIEMNEKAGVLRFNP